ncbi:hypothetical protein BDV3_005375 [Batrachochytrium dendrobatidis]
MESSGLMHHHGNDQPVAGRQVFIGNLPFTMQSKDLKDVFNKTAGVTSVKVMSHGNGRSRGFGLVYCDTPEIAQSIITQFQGLELKGRQIEVRIDRVNRSNIGHGSEQHDGHNFLTKKRVQYHMNNSPHQHQPYKQEAVHTAASHALAAPTLLHSATLAHHGHGAVGTYHSVTAIPTTNSYSHGWNSERDHDYHSTIGDYNALQTFDVGDAIASIDLNSGTRVVAPSGVQDSSFYSNNSDSISPSLKTHHAVYPNDDCSGHSTEVQPHKTETNAGLKHQCTTLFVGNLPFIITWQDLKDLFRQAGDVAVSHIPTDGSGRSRGFGIVTMTTPEDAAKAIQMFNRYILSGRQLEVREDRHVFKASKEGEHHEHSHRTTRLDSPAPLTQYGGQHDTGHIRHEHGYGNRSENYAMKNSGITLFVGNLVYSVIWQELKDLFRSVGIPTKAEIVTSSSGRSRGFGFVTMATQEDANKAIKELNGTEFRGRKIEVRLDKFGSHESRGIPEALQGTQVLVGNLPFHMRWQDLKDIFRCVAEPQLANVRIDPETGRSQGVGTVRFQTEEDATRALSLNETVIAGRSIWVQIDKQAV